MVVERVVRGCGEGNGVATTAHAGRLGSRKPKDYPVQAPNSALEEEEEEIQFWKGVPPFVQGVDGCGPVSIMLDDWRKGLEKERIGGVDERLANMEPRDTSEVEEDGIELEVHQVSSEPFIKWGNTLLISRCLVSPGSDGC